MRMARCGWRRWRRGPSIDGDVLVDMRPDPKNRAKELIEDFMIAANGVSAKYLKDKGYPSLRRVLRSPKRWDRIVELAARWANACRPYPALRRSMPFWNRADRPTRRFPDLSLSVVKLLGSGEYALDFPARIAKDISGLRCAITRIPLHRTGGSRTSSRSGC